MEFLSLQEPGEEPVVKVSRSEAVLLSVGVHLCLVLLFLLGPALAIRVLPKPILALLSQRPPPALAGAGARSARRSDHPPAETARAGQDPPEVRVRERAERHRDGEEPERPPAIRQEQEGASGGPDSARCAQVLHRSAFGRHVDRSREA